VKNIQIAMTTGFRVKIDTILNNRHLCARLIYQ
jgi:hypothetical protein